MSSTLDRPEIAELLPPSAQQVGQFIDRKAQQLNPSIPPRTPKTVAGRLQEELVELQLAVGRSPAEIVNSVLDAIHNEALKISHGTQRTVFPSQLTTVDFAQKYRDFTQDIYIAGEIADVHLVLKDLIYTLGFTNAELLAQAEGFKWQRFTQQALRISEHGCLYTRKSHIS